MNVQKITGIAIFLISIFGCSGLFDSGIPWRDGKYILLWIDDPKSVRLSYEQSQNGAFQIIDEVVYSIGSNESYIVAKQHPDSNKSIINYYIVDKKNDSHSVIGPLSKEEFISYKRELKLPGFSLTLQSLE